MRYLALVTDYDGTLATHGAMPESAADAVRRLRRSGRRAILLTGRRLEPLQAVCPYLDLFDFVVVENGALVYAPGTRETTPLGEPPPASFVERLRELGVDRLEVGDVLVATSLPYHRQVLQAIQELGLELLVIFNRDAVMVLPSGVNKATGLRYALRKLGLSLHETVGVGDAENDHSFLRRCECAVAVANAIPSIRREATFVTQGEAGAGVTELIDELITTDLARLHDMVPRRRIDVGIRADGSRLAIAPFGINMLIAGPSASGKSTVAAGLVERLAANAYQICIVDPEGDYGAMQEVITLGSHDHPASVNELLAILEDPEINLNINLLGVDPANRPEYFSQLLPNLSMLRTRTGRPHWIVLDEAHHMLPEEWGHVASVLPQTLGETILVTVHPEHLPPAVLATVDLVLVVGPHPRQTMEGFARQTGHSLSWPDDLGFEPMRTVAWFPKAGEAPFSVGVIPPLRDRIRHRRKYAAGDMRYHSFYFRGPDGRLNLRAQNLMIFAQIAEGLDEETWLYHLHRGDFSHWFRTAVKDPYLADQAQRIEQHRELSATESCRLIRNLIHSRYTLPE